MVVLTLLGVGCAQAPTTTQMTGGTGAENATPPEPILQNPPEMDEPDVVFPVEGFMEGRTFKAFGEYIQDRFNGYHVGDDVEHVATAWDVPVQAIADGEVAFVSRVSGYGGVIVLKHELEGKTISSLYGHIDLGSTTLKTGDKVRKHEKIAVLGEGETAETDGERKHLHFALWEGGEVKLPGYVQTEVEVDGWINPSNFYTQLGEGFMTSGRAYDPAKDLGGDNFPIAFEIPEDWEVEYVPSIEALNLFTLKGEGSARERSQIFIRYFDASDFLTLSTVTIHDTQNAVVGAGDYAARVYDIQKKAGVADFKDQPAWRNARHIVTDFRGEDGFTRYYVVAANPDIDPDVYASVLESMTVLR